MGGLWDSLTGLGKLGVVAVVLISLLLLGLVYGKGGDNPGSSPPLPTQAALGQAPQPTASSGVQGIATLRPASTAAPPVATTSTSSTSPTAAAASATPVATARPATATPVESTPVPAPPTAIPVPPTATSAPPPPTAVATGPCNVGATVAEASIASGGTQSVSAVIVCGGTGIEGAPMTALFYYQTSSASCTGASDGSGRASCSLKVAQAASGSFIPVNVCFARGGQTLCAQTGFGVQ